MLSLNAFLQSFQFFRLAKRLAEPLCCNAPTTIGARAEPSHEVECAGGYLNAACVLPVGGESAIAPDDISRR